jgi:hypothetical protein
MKKSNNKGYRWIIVIVGLALGMMLGGALTNNCQGQMVWEVTPKSFTDEVGDLHTVVGIRAKLVSPIGIDTLASRDLTLYLEFVLDDNTTYNARNVSTNVFVAKMVAGGASDSAATAQIHQVMAGLLFGDLATKNSYASTLMGLYGYSLKADD